MDILALLQPIQNSISMTTLHQLSRIIAAMLAMTGRVTMLGISRWAGEGGSYRTIQRFYHTVIPWADIFWQLFRHSLFQKGGVYILAGDECVVSKAGKKTHGLDHFFAGLQQKVIPGLSFFVLSLVSVEQRRSYPISVEQTIRSVEEKAASQAKKAAKKAKGTEPKCKPGRPKGSKNKPKAEVVLNPANFGHVAHFCPNHACEYYGITAGEIHALVGYGTHGVHEVIQDFKCQACGKKFTARRNTILYRLKSHSELIVKILWLLALGVDVSALEEVFGVREITIRTWLCRSGMQGKEIARAVYGSIRTGSCTAG